MKKTHTNPFTREEIRKLQASPYVQTVTQNTVRFTEEFKQLAYEQKHKGKSMAQIFREHGISPEILGESRIAGFSYTLNKAAKREDGFRDRRSENYRHPAKEGEESTEVRLRELEHELAYTRQEVEFLKKLQVANMEAQKQWESKCRRS